MGSVRGDYRCEKCVYYKQRAAIQSVWFLPLEMTLSACIVSTRTDFLNLAPMDIWGQLTLHCGSCLVRCRIFTSIPGLYPLAASSHSVITTQTVSICCQMSPGSELPLVQYPCSREAAGSAALSNYPTTGLLKSSHFGYRFFSVSEPFVFGSYPH